MSSWSRSLTIAYAAAGRPSAGGRCRRALATSRPSWSDGTTLERHFEAALQQSAGMGAPAFFAETQYDRASMLLRRGDQAGALDLAEQALAGAQKLGMSTLVRRATDVQRQAQALVADQGAPVIPRSGRSRSTAGSAGSATSWIGLVQVESSRFTTVSSGRSCSSTNVKRRRAIFHPSSAATSSSS